MKKSAVIALFAFAMLPFSACSSNNDQAAYMQNTAAEQNAREAEQAEEEFAQLAAKDETPKAEKPGKTEKKNQKTAKAEKSEKKSEKSEKKAVAKAETKTEKKVEAKKVEAKAESKAETKEARVPASTHETQEPKHAASGSRVWTVQLGAFKVKENAEKLTAQLKGAGFPVMMVGKEGSKSGELYLVHLEPTPNKSEAQKWQTDLKLKSFDSTITSKRD